MKRHSVKILLQQARTNEKCTHFSFWTSRRCKKGEYPAALPRTRASGASTKAGPGLCPWVKYPLFFLFLCVFASSAAADQSFSLSPAKMELKLDPGQSVIRNIYLANKTDRDMVFKVGVEDISAGKTADDIVEFYGSSSGPYSIKNYILIGDNSVEVKSGQTAVVPVMVTLPYNAAPGGLYGSVLFTLANAGTASANARFSTRLGSLIFLRVKGPVLERGDVTDFSAIDGRAIYDSQPVKLQIVYENLGNVYQNPYGYVEIKNYLTQAKTKIKIPPYFVFPNSTRMKEAIFDGPHFGYYHATLYLNKGYNNQIATKTYDFFIIPLNLIILIIFILIVGFGSFRAYRKFKAKKQNETAKI